MPKKDRNSAAPAASLEALLERARDFGAARAKVIPAAAVAVGEWVRWKCQFGCGCYGTRRSCPPHSPTPESTRRALACYRRAILLEGGSRPVRETVADLEREVFLAGFHQAFGMASGPCHLCKQCRLEGPCRFPERSRPAMEACGVDVFATVRAAGWELRVVRSEQETAHYFGLVLVD
jgi:predicted metal-binding protein